MKRLTRTHATIAQRERRLDVHAQRVWSRRAALLLAAGAMVWWGLGDHVAPDDAGPARATIREPRSPAARAARRQLRTRVRALPGSRSIRLSSRDSSESAAAAAPATGVVRGEVETERGEPVPRLIVTALDTRTGRRHRTITNIDGDFAIPDLSPGEYQLWATRPSRVRLRSIQEPDASEMVSVVAGDEAWAALIVPDGEAQPAPRPAGQPGTVRGRVLADDTGAPIANATVLAAPDDEGSWRGVIAIGTDESGDFVLDGVPSGNVRLVIVPGPTEATDAPYLGRPVSVEVAAGSVSDLEPIRLARR